MVLVIPQPIGMRYRGYAWHLKGELLGVGEKCGNFYKIAFSPEENALIKAYDTNITKLGLMDTSFLYLVFKKGRIQEKKAKVISAPLARMKKGMLKTIECYPLATFKEIEAVNPCQWEKGNVIIEAETLQPEGTDSMMAIDSAAFGPEDASFFQNQYSSVRKTGLAHIFYKASLIYKFNPFEALTNIGQNHQNPDTLHLRKPENCCNMFQFAKLLFHNQVLFEKNVFREMVEEEGFKENEAKNIASKAFFEKVEEIYEKFEKEKNKINNTSFSFLQKEKIEEVAKPEINFQNTHFKFNRAFSGNSRRDSGLPIAVYLTKKEGEYYIYWQKDKNELNGENLKETAEFLKFYLTFCTMLQIAAKEFLPEMLPENI